MKLIIKVIFNFSYSNIKYIVLKIIFKIPNWIWIQVDRVTFLELLLKYAFYWLTFIVTLKRKRIMIEFFDHPLKVKSLFENITCNSSISLMHSNFKLFKLLIYFKLLNYSEWEIIYLFKKSETMISGFHPHFQWIHFFQVNHSLKFKI